MAILAFGVLIIVHELGHFTLAKLNGVRVEEFSIGMGPNIFSKQGKETKYSLRLFPIGGYVKMMGEEENVEDERSFSAKSSFKKNKYNNCWSSYELYISNSYIYNYNI